MITGIVRSNEGRIRLKVIGLQSQEIEVEAVIDTGYSGHLTLPPAVIKTLALPWKTSDRATLADGSQCLFDVYDGKVQWDGEPRRILVDEADAQPLAGMRLLKGYELKMQVRAGGKVTIKQLPHR
ncbi:MAG TPA: clan AA aspartic protease [Gemmataceae bacterium]|jgi:clan AA aspartic protease|nr:clan AA aspartic protease [Gemmataceae bacterium]